MQHTDTPHRYQHAIVRCPENRRCTHRQYLGSLLVCSARACGAACHGISRRDSQALDRRRRAIDQHKDPARSDTGRGLHRCPCRRGVVRIQRPGQLHSRVEHAGNADAMQNHRGTTQRAVEHCLCAGKQPTTACCGGGDIQFGRDLLVAERCRSHNAQAATCQSRMLYRRVLAV